MNPTRAREEAERIAGIAELEVMAFRSQDPEALDRLNQAMVQLRDVNAAALLAAAKVKEGCVRTSDILGDLPKTADGKMCGAGAIVYHPTAWPGLGLRLWLSGNNKYMAMYFQSDYTDAVPLEDCYSTPQAARNAEKNA